jgi:DNA-binding MarR family transcriptional regulator
MAVVAARHELTPQQVGLLRMLGEPVSMRELAEGRSCDPSNVTGLVDRAERLGLVARTPNPRDRRVRMLELTEEGRRVRALVTRELAVEVRVALGITADDDGNELARLLLSLGGAARRG